MRCLALDILGALPGLEMYPLSEEEHVRVLSALQAAGRTPSTPEDELMRFSSLLRARMAAHHQQAAEITH